MLAGMELVIRWYHVVFCLFVVTVAIIALVVAAAQRSRKGP